jgi:hypothetical protein
MATKKLDDLKRIIKYRGIFDVDGLMTTMRNWIEYQGYEFHERGLKHKVPSPAGAEKEYSWWGWRKVNPYVKYNIDIFFKLWNLKEIEVVKNGKKQKAVSAAIQIEISGSTEIDWQNRFAGSKFIQALGDFYYDYIMKKPLDLYWTDQLYYHHYKLHTIIKEFLDMSTKTNSFAEAW